MAYVVGGVLFLSGLVHVVVLLVTGWTWIGPVSLRKAATFGLSFGLTLASVAWATSFLRLRARELVLGAFLVMCVVETALVTLQAWRGVPSHFDFATPFDTAVSMTLAAGGARDRRRRRRVHGGGVRRARAASRPAWRSRCGPGWWCCWSRSPRAR